MTPKPRLPRRAFCLCCLATPAAAGLLVSQRARAAPKPNEIVPVILADAARATIHVHRLPGGVAVLEGSGGNMAVLTGPDGKLLVDAGIAVSRPQISTALELLGPEPITQLINTHWHFDHSSGNAWLHVAGARITAQENTRKHLLSAQRVEDWDYLFPAPVPAAVPEQVFGEQAVVRHNGLTLELKHYGPAHTDSDISVHFREPDILHAGDTFWNGVYPMIDYSTGGHIDGMIKAADANLAATTERTTVVSGHGKPVGNRGELQEYRDMLVGVRARVAEAKRSGASLDAIVAGQPTASWDEKWGQFVIGPDLFTRLVYEGL